MKPETIPGLLHPFLQPEMARAVPAVPGNYRLIHAVSPDLPRHIIESLPSDNSLPDRTCSAGTRTLARPAIPSFPFISYFQ